MINDQKESVFNLTKALTEEILDSVMKKMKIEDTKENREDVLALALNYLPAKYVTTDEGKQYSKLIEMYRAQYESDVVTALTKACIKVNDHPRNTEAKEAGN